MLGPEPITPHRTAVEVVLKLGTTADIIVDTDPQGHPILGFVTPEINVLIMPNSASEGGAVTQAELDQASALVMAAARYRDELHHAAGSTLHARRAKESSTSRLKSTS